MFHYRDDPEYRAAELNLLNQSILAPNIYFSKFMMPRIYGVLSYEPALLR